MTVKDAVSIKGTNPQYLIEKIIRSRIYESRYWKEECFALTAELLVDKAMELKYIGGAFAGNVKPTPFLCLTLKMLQIQPEKDIVIEFIRNEEFKYVRFLGAFYMRLTGSSTDVFKYLEPLYVDFRKMKRLSPDGKFELVHMDEMIDELLRAERVCQIALPRLQKRHVMEELNQLEIRVSPLDVNLDELESSEEEPEEKQPEVKAEAKKNDKKKKDREKGKDKDKERKERRKRSVSSSASDRGRSASPDRDKDRKRSKPERRGRYVDYDNPENESPRYKRTESPRRRRSRSRSDDRDKQSHKSHRRDHDEDDRRQKRDKYDRDRRSRSKSKEKRHKKKEQRRSRSRS